MSDLPPATEISDRAHASALLWRAGLCFALAAVELPFLAFLYDPLAINNTSAAWLNARAVLREAPPYALFFMAALAILITPRRQEIFRQWTATVRARNWRAPLWINLALFALIATLTPGFNHYGAALEAPPWGLFFLWSAGIGAAYAALMLAAAPASFWRDFLNRERIMIAFAAGAAMIVETAALLSRQSWNALSEATFNFSALILKLYERGVVTVPERRIIGIDDFKVNIAAACSGYEGIGLVATFLAIYLWIFRSALRFPNVFLILPVGVAAIWILNSVRIAALVSLGAHVSPEIAITGFHSQAGWMMFLVVTIAMMLATHRIPFFHDQAAAVTQASPSPEAREAAALLAPFLAMTAAGILAAAFTSEEYWLYALRVIAICLALFAFWRFYKGLNWRIGWTPIILGLIVGTAWIATDPGRGGESARGVWLDGQARTAAVFWIAMRLFGTIILVPLAEELTFRGYLHRKLIADKFTAVAEGAFSWKAFIISTALFAALHERWLAGALAGAVFALALYRSGKITGAIAAHMSANALIAFWAIIFGQWSLL